jgi:sulfur-carrier protein adenylyltransferase/sulfurtransferase
MKNGEEPGGVSAISVTELKSKMDHKEKFMLVDVREPEEYEIVRIPGSVLMPKEEFFNGRALEKLPKDIPIILHCRSGVRSADCLAVLKEAGYKDATHVAGGVLAWVKDIDPSLPIY